MLIGINGFKGAGKDTVGDHLVQKYGFKKASFAALLKQSAAALFDIEPELWDEWKNTNAVIALFDSDGNEHNVLTARQFLQRYGTESHRDVFGYDFWVEQAFKNLDLSERLVFTDARFQNELEAIHSNKGVNFQVLRKKTDAEAGNHASEVRPDSYLIDVVLHNDHDKDWLYNQVDNIMDKYEL